MPVLPYKIGTLLYAFNAADEVLLIRRALPPNQGLWSPPGGKLITSNGESPHGCGCREAGEEMGLELAPKDLRLMGMVSEAGYEGQAHWLMFLFVVLPRLQALPPPHREGTFSFFSRKQLDEIPMPRTDREQLWPLFWQHRQGFFVAHCEAGTDQPDRWNILQQND